MKAIFALLLLTIGISEAAGQSRAGGDILFSDPAARAGLGLSFVSVMKQADGTPLLVINYPWRIHAHPSVEVSTVPDDQPRSAAIRPLYFAGTFMKGDTIKAFYECQDQAAEAPVKLTFTEKEIDFEVFGQRNSLTKPAVSVACQSQVPETKDTVDRALFCLLEPWAGDRRTLLFDLPRDRFSKPSMLRVWFLRGDDVLWTETVKWSGYTE